MKQVRARRRGWIACACAAALAAATVGPGTVSVSWGRDEVAPGRERVSGAARLLAGEGAAEYWDLVAAFPSGHWVIARFLITNAGPGERNGVAIGHVVGPDGLLRKFRNGKAWGSWHLSGDQLALEVGDSHLDLRGPPRRLQVEKGKVKIDLKLSGGTSFPLGTSVFPAGQGGEVVAAGMEVTGSVWVRGMAGPVVGNGVGSLIHGWSDSDEFRHAARRIDVVGLDAGRAFHLVAVAPPTGASRAWLGATPLAEGKQLFTAVEAQPRGQAWGDEDYPVAAELGLKGVGVTGRVRLERPLLEYDPLEDFAQPWRWVISLSTKPRRYWSRCVVELQFPGPETEAPGLPLTVPAVAVLTYFNPFRQKPETPSP